MRTSLDEPAHLAAEGDGVTTTPAGAFKRSLAEWLEIKDWEAVNIVMAMAAALYLPGDPVWTIVVGPSGGGKTELLMSFTGSEDVQLLSSLTSHTLLSGLQGKKSQATQDRGHGMDSPSSSWVSRSGRKSRSRRPVRRFPPDLPGVENLPQIVR